MDDVTGQTKALLIGGGIAITAALAFVLRRYALTSHGENPWNLDALLNVLGHRAEFEKARAKINGTFNSVFRSPQLNEKLKDLGYAASATSLHMKGLATDISPGKGITPQKAAEEIYADAKAGKLGDVYEVIWEPTWVHVGWRGKEKAPGKINYLKKTDDGYKALA